MTDAPTPGAVLDDPMERAIAEALTDAGIKFWVDGESDTHGLDFHVPDAARSGPGVFIEVKQFHSPRIAEQMSRASNVVVVQGRGAVEWFCNLVRLARPTPEGEKRLWQKPEIEQDEGEICVRAFTTDNRATVSFSIRKDKVIVCESAVGQPGRVETIRHYQFATPPAQTGERDAPTS